MNEDSNYATPDQDSALVELRLLHLADSALPIGAFAHSFGVETLVSAGMLQVPDLDLFLQAWLEEAGVTEAVFCRAAWQLGSQTSFPAAEWLELNEYLSALKPARESRKGSAVLGGNFLRAALAVCDQIPLRRAEEEARKASVAIHHACAFGLVSGTLQLDEDRAVRSYLHQSVAGLVSACQRLMPLGQTRAQQILWHVKSPIVAAARSSGQFTIHEVSCFLPQLDWGAMEHPDLFTRLFIS
ncbi:MAG TPA: urease accessory UreF family protein [Candidatus Acidoferrales bacterium]|nr:urease accessory UreF family protein [Candidatus Acidoferrales bacterium]